MLDRDLSGHVVKLRVKSNIKVLQTSRRFIWQKNTKKGTVTAKQLGFISETKPTDLLP